MIVFNEIELDGSYLEIKYETPLLLYKSSSHECSINNANEKIQAVWYIFLYTNKINSLEKHSW